MRFISHCRSTISQRFTLPLVRTQRAAFAVALQSRKRFTLPSVRNQRATFAFGVPSQICRFHPYTRNSTLLCLTQVNWFREHSTSFCDFHFQLNSPPTCPSCLVILKNTCPPLPPGVAATGIELARAFFSSPVMIMHSAKELYKRHYPSSLTRYLLNQDVDEFFQICFKLLPYVFRY